MFTPLLPSVAVGTLNPHSIIQPTRYITRHKTRAVSVIEAEAQQVDVRHHFLFPYPHLLQIPYRLPIRVANQQDCHFHRYFRPFFPFVPNPEPDNCQSDNSAIQGEISSTTIPYDYLVFAVGAEVQTFNIPGVKENACFMKELADAEAVRSFSVPSPFRNAIGDGYEILRCNDVSWIVCYQHPS